MLGLDDEKKGMIRKHHKGNYVVIEELMQDFGLEVNPEDLGVDNRFNLAKKLAELLLPEEHRNQKLIYKLAEEILMPWGMIAKAQDEGIKSVYDIANRLMVLPHIFANRVGVPVNY